MHTPGTWYTTSKPDAAQGLICEEETGRNIAVSYDVRDAHIIAAAPVLLANLEQLVRTVEDFRSGRLVTWPASVLPQARAALEASKP